MKKKFSVDLEWLMTGTVEVEAENEGEAQELALNVMDLPEGTYSKGSGEVLDVTEID